MMLGEHRVSYRAYIHVNGIIITAYYRKMLIACGFGGVRDECFHILAAAYERYAFIFKHFDKIAAVAADIKFVFHR